jgi:hypothetical protein
MPFVIRGGIAAVSLACLTALVPGRPVTAPCDTSPWTALVRAHLKRYPAMQPADAYKLLHQATLGSEHAMPSRAMAEQWLAREIATLGAGPAEPLVDTLGMGGRFARIHLRPFLASNGIPDSLLNAFVRTAQEATRDTAQLACALEAVRQMTASGTTSWAADKRRSIARGNTDRRISGDASQRRIRGRLPSRLSSCIGDAGLGRGTLTRDRPRRPYPSLPFSPVSPYRLSFM